MNTDGSLLQAAVESLPDAGFLLVWAIGPLGDCACPRRYNCVRPGKHPFTSGGKGEEAQGFPHGALSAVSTRAEAEAFRNPRNRLAVVPGGGLLCLDLDSDRAWRTFVRWCADEIPGDQFLGAVKTPRGYHVWVLCEAGGWEMGSAVQWMKHWLATRPDLGGIELRVGSRSYALWGEGLDGRRFLSAEEFGQRLAASSLVAPPAGGAIAEWGPPWLAGEERVVFGKPLGEWQGSHVSSDQAFSPLEISALGDWDLALARLEKACARLAAAPDGTKNNTLNAVAFYQGAEALWAAQQAGNGEQAMVDVTKLLGAAYWAEKPWDKGGKATIASGLTSGLKRISKQITGAVA